MKQDADDSDSTKTSKRRLVVQIGSGFAYSSGSLRTERRLQSSSSMFQRFKNPAEGTGQRAVDNLGYQKLVQRKLGSKRARKEVLATES